MGPASLKREWDRLRLSTAADVPVNVNRTGFARRMSPAFQITSPLPPAGEGQGEGASLRHGVVLGWSPSLPCRASLPDPESSSGQGGENVMVTVLLVRQPGSSRRTPRSP